MENNTKNIMNVFNENCNTIIERQEAILLKEKRKLFRECVDEITEGGNKSLNVMAIEKFKSLLFKLEDHNEYVLEELLEQETKRYLKAIYADVLIANKNKIIKQHTKEFEYDVEALDYLMKVVDEKEYPNEDSENIINSLDSFEVDSEVVVDNDSKSKNEEIDTYENTIQQSKDDLSALIKELEGMI